MSKPKEGGFKWSIRFLKNDHVVVDLELKETLGYEDVQRFIGELSGIAKRMQQIDEATRG